MIRNPLLAAGIAAVLVLAMPVLAQSAPDPARRRS